MKAKRILAFVLMLIMAVTPVAVVSALDENISVVAEKAFTPRLSAPSKSNDYYYSNKNIFYSIGYGMPNCTAYAWGRAYEILGHKPNLSVDSAHYWWGFNKDGKYYPYGKTPKVGAIACWNNSSGGHVAVVEKIENGEITFSNSGYGYKTFYLTTCDVNAPTDGSYNYNWKFYGYIYITDGASLEDYYASLGGDVYTIDSDDGVNLRKGAGTSYKTLTAIPDKTQIVVTETKKADGYTWGKTKYDGYTGWCVLNFAKLVYKQPEATKPTTPPATAPTTLPTEPVTTTVASTGETLPATVPVPTGTQLPSASDPAESAPVLGGVIMKGDVNGDGKVSVSDATLVQKHLASVDKVSDEHISHADANGDGQLTIADATYIQKTLAGLNK